MTNKQLAIKIYNYIPKWEQPHLTKKENLFEIMQELEDDKNLKDFYDYLYEDDASENLQVILNELKKRLEV